MHTLVELWAWNRNPKQLSDRSDSPWDNADRRPSHANRRKALRQQIMRNHLSTITTVWSLPRNIIHLAEELPGEARKAFDVPPLAFGIECIEGQRAFARPAHAGQANQLVPRQHQIDVSQVVLAGAFDDDIGSRHVGDACRLLGNVPRGAFDRLLPNSLL